MKAFGRVESHEVAIGAGIEQGRDGGAVGGVELESFDAALFVSSVVDGEYRSSLNGEDGVWWKCRWRTGH